MALDFNSVDTLPSNHGKELEGREGMSNDARELRREQAGRALRDFLEQWAIFEPDAPSFERTWWLPIQQSCEEVSAYLNSGVCKPEPATRARIKVKVDYETMLRGIEEWE